MKRIITTTITLAALLAAAVATADTITDRRWIEGPASTANYRDWRPIDSVLECSYGPWELVTQADGSRSITRTKACTGNETVRLGVFPQ